MNLILPRFFLEIKVHNRIIHWYSLLDNTPNYMYLVRCVIQKRCGCGDLHTPKMLSRCGQHRGPHTKFDSAIVCKFFLFPEVVLKIHLALMLGLYQSEKNYFRMQYKCVYLIITFNRGIFLIFIQNI